MTNLEWIKSLSMTEMITFILSGSCQGCIFKYDGIGCAGNRCEEGVRAWLARELITPENSRLTMNKELKPCPFCGGKAKFQSGVICCSDCGAKTRYVSSKELAIESWNGRIGNGKVDGD